MFPKSKTLFELKNNRNKLEHYKLNFIFEEIYVITINVLSIIMDFINDNIKELSVDEEFQFDELKELLSGLEQYLIIREQTLKGKYPKQLFYYCPRCGRESIVINDNVYCEICHYKNNPNDCATDYIENIMNVSSYECGKDGCKFPQYNCPHCESESFINDNTTNNVAFCYSCGEDRSLNDYSFCENCGQFYESDSDDFIFAQIVFKTKLMNMINPLP